MANNVLIKKYPSLEEAGKAATKTYEAIGGRVFPITLFKQGNRQFISAVFPITYIINELKTKSTEKNRGIKDARLALNRPLDPKHAEMTKDYLLKNYKAQYILPPMTLNIQDAIELHVFEVLGNYLTPGYMAVPYGIKLSITDGQHRRKALEDLYNELEPEDFAQIQNDGIPVMVTIEDSLSQIHQDFADCSKTKALPKSLIAAYDKRNPANSLVIDLIEKCPLFKDKVDATANTLSKNSVKLLLVSQVRSIVKELSVGTSAVGDADFDVRAEHLYTDIHSLAYKETLTRFVNYINAITEKIPILKKVASLSEGVEMSIIPSLRGEYLVLNSAGLNIIGRIGNEMLNKQLSQPAIDHYIELLGKIDWKKDGALWQGSIVTRGTGDTYKIANSNASMKLAVKAVKDKIGLDDEMTNMLF